MLNVDRTETDESFSSTANANAKCASLNQKQSRDDVMTHLVKQNARHQKIEQQSQRTTGVSCQKQDKTLDVAMNPLLQNYRQRKDDNKKYDGHDLRFTLYVLRHEIVKRKAYR
jgi:hypothetical protein